MRLAVVRVFSLLVLLTLFALPALADTFLLDGGHVSDWARSHSPYSWRQKDSCLDPNGLLKFDISEFSASGPPILQATVYFTVEAVDSPSSTASFWFVRDDTWKYGVTSTVDLSNWPVTTLLGTQTFTAPNTVAFDITAILRDEVAQGSRELSFKITDPNGSDFRFRVSSPLSPIQRNRPFIKVETGVSSTLSDLTVSTADIHFSDMQPIVPQHVTVSADIRNIGPYQARDVLVYFYDGNTTGTPIGSAVLPLIPGSGGVAVASINWTIPSRGIHDIWVVVDPLNRIIETDERNNSDFRAYWVSEPPNYQTSVESFEHPAFRWWQSDFDVPNGCYDIAPKGFYLNRGAGQSYDGDYSLELFLDGTSDNGTIWIERAVPVKPFTPVDVKVDWELFRYFGDIAFSPVGYAGVLDPEKEGDFEPVVAPSQPGWTLCTYSKRVDPGPYDMVYIAIGLTCTWEITGTFYFDLIHTEVTPGFMLRSGDKVETTSTELLPIQPNPARGNATIAFNLPLPGQVKLQVYDAAGRLVKTLLDGPTAAGMQSIRWDGTNLENRKAPSGVYLYRLDAPGYSDSRKLLLVH